MSGVEQIGDAKLYLGDCREILPTLGKIDAVVTDPPYGIGYHHSGSGKGSTAGLRRVQRNSTPIIGDDEPFDPSHLFGIADDLILWGANHYADKLPASPGWLVWDKLEWTIPDKFSDCELAWHMLGTRIRKLPLMWKGVRVAAAARGECGGAAKRFHPNQKPIALMEWCLSFVRGEIICDPYMGSGSTGVACAGVGLAFVGIEVDPKFFDIACRRIEAAQRQGRLFDERPAAKASQDCLGLS